jgi:peptidoglycan/LPS O-acetylase OafA/YrhL
VHALGGSAPLAAVVMLVPLFAIAIAAYYYVERPAMHIGRTLSDHVESLLERRRDQNAAVIST